MFLREAQNLWVPLTELMGAQPRSPGGGVARLEPVPTSEHFLVRNCAKKDLFLRTDKKLATSCCRRVPEKPNFEKKKWDNNLATSKKQRSSCFYRIVWAANFTLDVLVERKNCKVMGKKWNSCRLCQDVFFGRVLSMLLLPTSFRSKKNAFQLSLVQSLSQWISDPLEGFSTLRARKLWTSSC